MKGPKVNTFLLIQLFLFVILLATCFFDSSNAGFACVNNPCINGICIDDLNSTYSCYCVDGYTGVHCQTNWDECWSTPCLNGGTCYDGIASYSCLCSQGYTGKNCEVDIDECISNPCQNNATCFDQRNGYICVCIPGYSGIYCEVDLAVCNNTEEMQCYNNGLCVEGPGLTYTCQCQPGWTGKVCEEQVDECASVPCQNGAICIDHQATYSCACLFGFTGHNCEFELQLCEMNLCKNDAICIIENDTRACYCVPDYHGEKCEFQYDECQLAVGCLNGGTCIDGVDNYSCSCPLRTTGVNCECIIQPDGKTECELYVTQIYNDTQTTQDTFSTFSYYEEPEVTSKIEGKDISTDTTIKYTDESNTNYYSTTSKEFTTQYDIDISNQETSTPFESSTTVPQTPEIPDQQETTEVKYIATKSPSPDISTTEDTSTTPIHEITSPVYQMPNWTDFDIFSSTTNIQPGTGTGTEIDILSSTSTEERTSTTEEPDQPGSYTSVESTLSTFDTTMKEITSSADVTTTEQGTLEVTENEYCVDIYCTTKVIQTESYPTHISILNTTFINETDSTEDTIFDINCSFVTCLNGGTCYVSQRGPKCSCKFGWDGSYCQEVVEIKVAAFTGKSYLVHKLENDTSIIVSLNLRTLSNSGIILYAQITPEMYMCLHLQNGFLKFQFSCGIQTMLFSEMKYRVNTGYHVSLLATLSMSEKGSIIQEGVCNAALRINDTVAMSGEQTATITSSHGYSSYLYIGGLPFYLVQQIDLPVTSGITGCINQLKIDGIDKNIYADAIDGLAISECSSLACLSNPCYNEATCVENGNTWNCLCPSGYVGDTCEQSVCANNLCNFGATCVPHPASGFLCLCPLEKHGLFCQYDVEIDQPTFSSTIRGWSSFAGYNVPSDALLDGFQLKFKFIPETIEQISLMIFVGQAGKHSSTSDHLAISFIKGYIALTWNLGGGPRRIFTPHAIAKKPKKAHSVIIGRAGSNAWLLVEGFKNITGKSNSRYTKLNVTPTIYVGGHESYNFATLPNDIPLHMGFSGCLYDMELNVGHITLGLQKKRPAIGRSVAQCGTSECHNYTCQHAGACVQHGSSLACLCPDGWFGPVCAHRYNLCDSNRHKCASGSTCVPLSLIYECDCPVGVTGKFCDKVESQLSDVSFSGVRSFLSLNSSWDFQTKQFIVEFQLRPQSDNGLILFVQSKLSRFFISLSLWGGVMEFRVLTSGNNKKSDQDKELIIVKSGKVIPTEEWTKVKFGRFGQKVYLSVNGMTNAGLLPTNSNLPLQNATIYFGGLEDLSDVPRGALSGLPTSYKGCIRQFSMNYKKVALYQQHIKNGRNIADCDGTSCGGEICENGGSCWLNISLQPHCVCPEEYVGERCETLISCKEVACKNNGRCVIDENKPKCHCPLGWIGPFCEKEMPVGIPLFKGDGYLVLEKPRALVKRHQSISFNKNTLEYIQVQFSTTQKDGLILWTSLNEDYFGIGIENYCMKVVWSWQQQEEKFQYNNTSIDDGNWHSVTAEFTPSYINFKLDNEIMYQRNHTIPDYLHTDGLFYLGGYPNHNVSYVTQNAFTNNFAGCISELSWKEYTIKSFKKHKGENIDTCDIY